MRKNPKIWFSTSKNYQKDKGIILIELILNNINNYLIYLNFGTVHTLKMKTFYGLVNDQQYIHQYHLYIKYTKNIIDIQYIIIVVTIIFLKYMFYFVYLFFYSYYKLKLKLKN